MFHGSIVALVTPMTAEGGIDYASLQRLVEFHVENGTGAIVAMGTTGESATLDEDEHCEVMRRVAQMARGRIPVIGGTGANSTHEAIALTRCAMEGGVDACLLVTPYYNKPTQEGLIAHYTAIAEATDLPLVLYNVPGRTGITMNPQTTITLSRIPTIAGIKEAAGSLDIVTEIVGEAHSEFVVLSGDDSLTLPMMSVGARGVISVLSNILPTEVTEMVQLANMGYFEAARARHLRLFDVMRAMFTGNNPTAVKTAAELLGLCSSEVRLPLIRLNDAQYQTVERAIQPWMTTAQPMAAD